MTQNVEVKPTAAFFISLFSGIFTLLTAFLATQLAPLRIAALGLDTNAALVLASAAGALITIGSYLMYENTSNTSNRRFGSLLVVGFSIISMNFIGLILGLIGGFLGLSSKSETGRY